MLNEMRYKMKSNYMINKKKMKEKQTNLFENLFFAVNKNLFNFLIDIKSDFIYFFFDSVVF